MAQGVAEATSEADGAVDDGQAEVTALSETLENAKTPVDEIKEGLEEAFESLSERAAAAEARLGELLDQARDFLLEEVVGDLKALQERLHEEADQVVAQFELGQAEVKENFEVWSANMDSIREKVGEAFENAGPYLQESVQETLDTLEGAQGKALEELSGDVQDLESALQALAQLVGECESTLASKLQGVDGAAEETADELAAARATLEKVTEVLASYTFVTG
jgi:polyhydroxyalkanoate synthesis regulator phasin